MPLSQDELQQYGQQVLRYGFRAEARSEIRIVVLRELVNAYLAHDASAVAALDRITRALDAIASDDETQIAAIDEILRQN